MKIWSWQHAIAETRMTSKAKLVGFVLANHMTAMGQQAWPSLARIGAHANLSKPTVLAAIDELVEIGLVVKKKRGLKGKEWASNLYEAVMPEGSSHITPSQNEGSKDFTPTANPPVEGLSPFTPDSAEGSNSFTEGVKPVDTNYPLNQEDVDVVSAHAHDDMDLPVEKPRIHPDFDKVQKRGIKLFPGLITRHPGPIHQWLADGWDAVTDIIPAFEQCAGSDPKSWAYFTPVIREAVAQRKRAKGAKQQFSPIGEKKREYRSGPI